MNVRKPPAWVLGIMALRPPTVFGEQANGIMNN